MSTTSAATTSFSKASAHSMGFCSTSSASSPFTGPVNIDKDGFLRSSLRAGGPYLCSLPAITHPLSSPPSDDAMLEIEGFASRVLRDLNLRFRSIELMGRLSKIDSEPHPVPTVLIQMPNYPQPELWHRAARQIKRDLHRHNHHGLCVELIESDLLRGVYCSPVEIRHTIIPKWPDIVHRILAHANTSEWVGLDCWRYGTNTRKQLNPVTVIVRVAKSSENSFMAAARLIHGVLAGFNEGAVDVLFMKDGTKSFVMHPTLPLESVSGSVYPGVSIGIHRTPRGSSTMGGFVQLRFKNDEDWYTYGLTCFHCVHPPEPYRKDRSLQGPDATKALERWFSRPLTMFDENDHFRQVAKRILHIDHPSVEDLKQTVQRLNENIKTIKSKEFCELKEQMDLGENGWLSDGQKRRYHAMCDHIQRIEVQRETYGKMLKNGSYHLGHVVAGSGMNRTRSNQDRLRVSVDWALIKMSKNRIHRQTHGTYISGNKPFPYSGADPQPEFFYNPKIEVYDGLKMFKSGRSTGVTEAVFNGLRSVELDRLKSEKGLGHEVRIKWTTKISFMDKPFAEPGDSGAWIYAMDGSVFGLLTGGDERQGTTYVCRMKDVFDDIKDITGAVEVRTAQAPSS